MNLINFKTGLVAMAAFSAFCTSEVPKRITIQPDSVYAYKPASADGIGKVYKGREIAHVMGFAGAGWLERDTRQLEENVEQALKNLPITQSSVVADIGAGTGYYTFRIAPRVGKGKVYAVELQDDAINYLRKKATQLKLSNVTVIKGSEKSPNLPAASIDLAIMVDVYHELAYPHEYLQALRKALKPDGKLLLLEYRGEDPTIPIKELHKTTVSQLDKELGANSFKLVSRKEFLPIQHFLVYGKTDEI